MSGDGVVAHNRRTYFAENVDQTRTHLNIEYCYTPIEQAYHNLFDEALAEFNAKQKRKDRCIENYYEKICNGKQEKLFYEVIFQIGNKDDMGAATENGELAKTILDKFYHDFVKDTPYNCAQTIHIIPADQSFEKKRNSNALFAREINLVTQPSFDCEQGINSQVQTACSNADAVFPVLGIVFCKNERFSLSRKTHVQLWNEPRISHVRLL